MSNQRLTRQTGEKVTDLFAQVAKALNVRSQFGVAQGQDVLINGFPGPGHPAPGCLLLV